MRALQQRELVLGEKRLDTDRTRVLFGGLDIFVYHDLQGTGRFLFFFATTPCCGNIEEHEQTNWDVQAENVD